MTLKPTTFLRSSIWIRNKDRVMHVAHWLELFTLLATILISGMAIGAWIAGSIYDRDRMAMRHEHLQQLQMIQDAHQRALETLVGQTAQAAVAAEGAAVIAEGAAEKAGKASVKAAEAASTTARISRGQQAIREHMQRGDK